MKVKLESYDGKVSIVLIAENVFEEGVVRDMYDSRKGFDVRVEKTSWSGGDSKIEIRVVDVQPPIGNLTTDAEVIDGHG